MRILKFCGLAFCAGAVLWPLIWIVPAVVMKGAEILTGAETTLSTKLIFILFVLFIVGGIVNRIYRDGLQRWVSEARRSLYSLAMLAGILLAVPGMCGGPVLLLLWGDRSTMSITKYVLPMVALAFVIGWFLYRWGLNGMGTGVSSPITPPGGGPLVRDAAFKPPSEGKRHDSPDEHKPPSSGSPESGREQ